MTLFSKLFHNTLLYKTYNVIRAGYEYASAYSLISDTFYSDEFKFVLKRYLNLNVSKDWLGRLYGVINPNIDIDGKLNFNNTIIEIDGDNTNSSSYVDAWVYKQMALISELFKIEKLYDYINVDIKHVGPISHDNYLIVFDMVDRKNFTNSLKSFCKHSILYIVIAIITILVLI